MDEETTTTHVPIEQPPTQNRRLVLVGIVLTTVGIVYVLYRLLKSSPLPKKMIQVQQKMQIKHTTIPTPTAPHFQVFRREITEQIKKVRNMKNKS